MKKAEEEFNLQFNEVCQSLLSQLLRISYLKIQSQKIIGLKRLNQNHHIHILLEVLFCRFVTILFFRICSNFCETNFIEYEQRAR